MLLMQKLLKMLAKARRQNDPTVIQIASALGCTRQHVYDLSKKDAPAKLGLDEAERLARLFGYRLELVQPKKQKARAHGQGGTLAKGGAANNREGAKRARGRGRKNA